MSGLRTLVRGAALLGLLGLMLLTTTARHDDVFLDGRIYFVDADCYSRMTRVAHLLAAPWQSIRHHDFENFPAGVATHTTIPMDAAIALLATVLRPFSPQSLDLAGAWISPLLGLATLLALWLWSTRERLRGRHAMLFLLAVSPILVQAFRLGRPDHQSLLLLLLAVGLAAEWNLWRGAGRRTALVWGAAWGLALWTSLYEPLVLFALLLPLRFAALRRAAATKTWGLAWVAALVVFGAGVAFDGWRVSAPAPEVAAFFPAWSRQIGELASLPPWSAQFPAWLGWFGVLTPALLAFALFRRATPQRPLILGTLVLVLATFALTCWQIRWGCYLALAVAMAVPFAWNVLPGRLLPAGLFVVGLWPVAAAWDTLLDPGGEAQQLRLERRAELPQLRAIAAEVRGPFLAPWWLSPPVAYWSGQPGVTGSSHESLPGIVDAARFYLATDWADAQSLLTRRGVRFVLADDPGRVLGTAAQLVGGQPSPQMVGAVLSATPASVPPWLRPAAGTPFFRLYEVIP